VRNGAPLGVLCSGAAPILRRSFLDPLAKPWGRTDFSALNNNKKQLIK
jgi:hypothetical protein